MEDRELLELAAKAADDGIVFYGECWRAQSGREWNPLLDDGDALRLGVRLRISIDHNHSADQQRWVAADRNGCEGCYSPVSAVEDEFEENERPAATRRAIVRAAAAIGKEM
ncbi:hypothetical protein [Achromobacter xylosoxidans]|uniref:hypothetical protein n=1 Tax=Alcaligenes xylosoxydans xylosoxydans TaxID=85698 RepID=UPI001F13ABFF|nr:hypothetical protein [Achromobacter xylosoxidans]